MADSKIRVLRNDLETRLIKEPTKRSAIKESTFSVCHDGEIKA